MLRRSAIVLTGMAIAAFACRHAIAYGLVARGDDVLRGGGTIVHWSEPVSLTYYERAHRFDPQWDVPVDRFAFAASTTFDAVTLRRAIALAGDYLRVHPRASAIRQSRAICALHLGNVQLALRDIRLLAAAAPGDWRLTAMAAGLARRLGYKRESTFLWARAAHVRNAEGDRRRAS